MTLPDLTKPQVAMLLAIHRGETVNTSGNRATTVRALEKRRLVEVSWNRIELTKAGYALIDCINGVERRTRGWKDQTFRIRRRT